MAQPLPANFPLLRNAEWSAAYEKELQRALALAAKRAEAAVLAGGGPLDVVTRDALQREQARLAKDSKRIIGAARQAASNVAGTTISAIEQSFGVNPVVADLISDWVTQMIETRIDALMARLTSSQVDLSAQIYKTERLSSGWVDRQINNGLAQNLSAKDLARTLASSFAPNVPGGVSFASMRTARTEINNAFHAASLAHYDNRPWVAGIKWNLSGSHAHADECDDYANKSHYKNGPKGVFLQGSVPPKPHPQCLCYITPVMDSDEDFLDALVNGDYDDWAIQNIPGYGPDIPLGYTKAGKPIYPQFGGSGAQLTSADLKMRSGLHKIMQDNPGWSYEDAMLEMAKVTGKPLKEIRDGFNAWQSKLSTPSTGPKPKAVAKKEAAAKTKVIDAGDGKPPAAVVDDVLPVKPLPDGKKVARIDGAPDGMRPVKVDGPEGLRRYEVYDNDGDLMGILEQYQSRSPVYGSTKVAIGYTSHKDWKFRIDNNYAKKRGLPYEVRDQLNAINGYRRKPGQVLNDVELRIEKAAKSIDVDLPPAKKVTTPPRERFEAARKKTNDYIDDAQYEGGFNTLRDVNGSPKATFGLDLEVLPDKYNYGPLATQTQEQGKLMKQRATKRVSRSVDNLDDLYTLEDVVNIAHAQDIFEDFETLEDRLSVQIKRGIHDDNPRAGIRRKPLAPKDQWRIIAGYDESGNPFIFLDMYGETRLKQGDVGVFWDGTFKTNSKGRKCLPDKVAAELFDIRRDQAVSDFIHLWAISSNEGPVQQRIQDRTAALMGLKRGRGAGDYRGRSRAVVPDLDAIDLEDLDLDWLEDPDKTGPVMYKKMEEGLAKVPEFDGVADEILVAMYEETQEEFARRGITHLDVYRGAAFDSEGLALSAGLDRWGPLAAARLSDGLEIQVTTNPLSSWSTNRGIAENFALGSAEDGVSVVLEFEQCPVSQVFAMPGTGFGCYEEFEFVLMPPEINVTATRFS